MPQGRHWCLTVNNYGEPEMAQFAANQAKFSYYIYGKEVGESGTAHLQAYVCLHKKAKLTALKKLWPTAHLEIMRAKDPRAAADYCKKDGNYIEYGEVPLPQTAAASAAKSEIWRETKELAEANRLDDIDPEIYIKHYATLKRIRSDKRNRSIPKDLEWGDGHTPNEWIYGPTGTGKSMHARSRNEGYYLKMNNKWWESYEGEKCILIEDVGKSHEWMGDFLKIWADRYGFRGEIKQDSIVLRPEKIIVTSNYHPQELWPDPNIHEPLLRRFRLRHFETLKARDDTVPTKKTKRNFMQVTHEEAKTCPIRPPLYRMNAQGNLEKYADAQRPLNFSSIINVEEGNEIYIENVSQSSDM